jgi:hypothetical protein
LTHSFRKGITLENAPRASAAMCLKAEFSRIPATGRIVKIRQRPWVRVDEYKRKKTEVSPVGQDSTWRTLGHSRVGDLRGECDGDRTLGLENRSHSLDHAENGILGSMELRRSQGVEKQSEDPAER